MGALHRGHSALIERCREENDAAVVSIFINPTQFNDPRDLERYPKTLDQDLELLDHLGVGDVLIPSAAEMYPNGYCLRVRSEKEETLMEGLYRPGYFDGVLTVVLKLLNIVRANRAYFGEKDFQQLKAIRDMAADFFVPTEVIACPTIRDESGLAESSRNSLLSSSGRKQAARLFQTLSSAPTSAEAARSLELEGFRVDYVEEHWGRRFAAAFLEGVRLIDNVPYLAASGR
jgi:pantoate--beta-alanine ligase